MRDVEKTVKGLEEAFKEWNRELEKTTFLLAFLDFIIKRMEPAALKITEGVMWGVKAIGDSTNLGIGSSGTMLDVAPIQASSMLSGLSHVGSNPINERVYE